jgi:hypothetical protein
MMGQVLPIERGELPALSLDLPPGLSLEELKRIGRRLYAIEKSVQWQTGDWWNYVVEHHGEEAARRLTSEIWGVKGETARVYGWVAKKFDPVNRLTSLEFTHYQRAASLPQDEANQVIAKAADEGWGVRDTVREVHALKASNDPSIGAIETDSEPPVRAKPQIPNSADLLDAYARYAEVTAELEKFRELTRREADYLAMALDKLGEAHAERRPVPMDFRIMFRERGRVECERIYGASRITVTRWLFQCGMRELIDERANFVKHQRSMANQPPPAGQPVSNEIDTYLPVARMAADFLRIRRNGGWMISIHECGGWRVGTVQRTSEQLIAMAVNQGFDRDAAVAEARAEGY